ncbi:hypothetical protein KC346_g14894, partial [Hortaea werneckii]
VSSKGRRRRPSSKTLAQALKTDDDAFVDFIARCLRWDPDRRMKPSEAISHPFITNTTLNARPGIPDEARRAARARSTAAGPTAAAVANGTNAPASSPVKRNAFAQQAQTTPAISKTKASAGLQESSTPQQTSTIRSIFPPAASAAANAPQASPSKPSAGAAGAGNANNSSRRQSLAPSSIGNAAASAAAGSKRGANGAVLTGGGAGGGGLMSGQRTASGNMAAAAASASMSHGGGNSAGHGGSSRWRA